MEQTRSIGNEERSLLRLALGRLERVLPWLAVAVGSYALGWLHAVWTFFSRVTVPVVIAACLLCQARGQQFTMTVGPTQKGTNDFNLVCGIVYGGVVCVGTVAAYECYLELRRAATCIASNQNWKLTNAMFSAGSRFPSNAVIELSIGVSAQSAFEPNWSVEYSETPVGPWVKAAEWLDMPSDLEADVGPRYVVLPKGKAGFFRMRGWR